MTRMLRNNSGLKHSIERPGVPESVDQSKGVGIRYEVTQACRGSFEVDIYLTVLSPSGDAGCVGIEESCESDCSSSASKHAM